MALRSQPVLDGLWARLLEALSGQLAPAVLDSWLRPCRLLAVEVDHLRIGAPNPLARDWLMQHHLQALQSAAEKCLGGHRQVSIVVDDAAATVPDRPASTTPAPLPDGTAERLNPRYTFDTFVVGSSNQFAQAASQAVAELPSRAYNPLFIYGGVGLGKTHLLHAIGHRTGQLFPGTAVVYVSSEHFTNELINAIRYDHTAAFRARYRTIDLLLIDDIQFIAGKERTQEEFFHTFNDLYESRRQIVLSSDSPPKSIPDIEERLRSRFEWGLIADVQPPDFETRVAILKKKAALERALLTDDVAYLIAGRVKSNIRQLEGSLTRMIAVAAMTGRDMTADLAQEILSDLWGDEKTIIPIELIQRRVAEFFGIKLSEMKAKNRAKAVAFPRQVGMYLTRQLTHTSLAEVGRAFGGKDHTTVLHAVGKIQALLHDDPRLRKTIDGLIEKLTP